MWPVCCEMETEGVEVWVVDGPNPRELSLLLISIKHRVQLRLGMSFVLEVLSHKAKYWKNFNFYLMVALEVMSGDLNVCAKFHGKSSSSS